MTSSKSSSEMLWSISDVAGLFKLNVNK